MDRIAAMTTFVKVVEMGSLSAAARALELPLTTVSRQISGLEDRLRSRLLVRTTRHLALTDGGRSYYEQTKRILAAIEEAEIALSAQQATPSGRLIVSAPVQFGRVYLAHLLPEFLALHPGVVVDLLLVDRVVNLVDEGVDIAIRLGPLENSNLIAHRLGAFQRIICAAPNYLQRHGTPRQPKDLEHHDCIILTSLDPTQEWCFQTENGDLQIPISGRLRTNNFDVTVAGALGGAGLMLAPAWLVRDHLSAGRLTRVLQGFGSPPTDVHALFPHLRLMSAKVRAFMDFLVGRWVVEDFT
jgi:DNA-binding transcriptional LysR family regulator